MGAIKSCCASDAAHKESIDIVRRKGPEDDDAPLLGEEDEVENQSAFSKFTTPNITIKPEPVFADHIFHYPTY